MKVAVCVSGIPKGNVQEYLERMKYHFPYTYFFSTWEDQLDSAMKKIPNTIIYSWPEPEMHYHPVIDLVGKPKNIKLLKFQENFETGKFGTVMKNRTQHHTKQILGHAYLVNFIPPEYDMILRIRYDTWLSKKVDFHEYLNQSYNQRIAIGFGTRTLRHKNIDKFYEVPKIYPEDFSDPELSHDWAYYLMDPLIMHPRELFDTKYVWKLHKEKKLMPAEWGWSQILSEPYNYNHLSVYGGTQIERLL